MTISILLFVVGEVYQNLDNAKGRREPTFEVLMNPRPSAESE